MKGLTLGRRKEKFRQRNWGSNPGPLALRASALTTELSRHSRELRQQFSIYYYYYYYYYTLHRHTSQEGYSEGRVLTRGKRSK